MTKTIGIVLFPGFEDLDALGPKEVFGMFGGVSGGEWKTVFVSQDGGTILSSLGTRIVADYGFADSPALDVILVPGGLATRTEVDNTKLIDFVRAQGEKAAYSIRATDTEVWIAIPRFCNALAISPAISVSSPGRMRGASSTSVTAVPIAA